jgi:hypothetical protein
VWSGPEATQGWNAASELLSTDERRADRIRKEVTVDKKQGKLEGYQRLIMTSTGKGDQLQYTRKLR